MGSHKDTGWEWADICNPKIDGELGIKDLSKFNAALRGRWIWGLASNHNQLWARLLTSKYGGLADLQSRELKGGILRGGRISKNFIISQIFRLFTKI